MDTTRFAEGVNKWLHIRQPTPLDQQTVIRMNRDTLYIRHQSFIYTTKV